MFPSAIACGSTASSSVATCYVFHVWFEPPPHAREPEHPPGPPPGRGLVDELARLRDLSSDVLGTIAQRFAIYGDFYYVATPIPNYATCDPDLMHQVLVTEARSFVKRTTSLEVLGKGLLMSDGDFWRRQRRLIQPGFQRESIQRYGVTIAEEVEAMLSRWARRSEVEIRGEMLSLTLEIVCRALFGRRFGGNGRRLGHAVAALQEGVIRPQFIPRWIPTPRRLIDMRYRAIVDSEVYAIIDAPGTPRDALLYDLKAATDEQGRMSRQQLRDEVVTLFLAGHETTALTLTWALYLVSLHPAIEAALVDEVRSVAGNGTLGAEHAQKLELTERVLKETMRLYPPAYVLPRVAAERVKIGDYFIPQGAEVWLWPYFSQRDARYFARPDRFDPNRFLPDGEHARSPRAYLPFGAGSRACVGRHFAMLEAVIALASMVRRFRLTPVDARPLRTYPRITLAPARPVRMRLERR